MEKQTALPYQPSFVHILLDWLDRLPGPAWLFYLLFTAAVGITQHLLAYRQGLLAPGEFDPAVGLPGLFFVMTLASANYIIKAAAGAIDGFRPLISAEDHEFARLRYEFITIPRLSGFVAFLIGAGLGAVSGFADMAIADPAVYVLPPLRLGIWILSPGLGFPFIYQAVRQLRQMRRLYALCDQINLFRLDPLYKMSRYSAVVGILIFVTWFGIAFIANPSVMGTQVVVFQSIALATLIILMFFYPLLGINQRLAAEKERLLDEVNAHIETLFDRSHQDFAAENYADMRNMQYTLEILTTEKAILQGTRTWPWQPGTLTALLSALLSPLIIGILRELISNFLGI